jgi:hypothetical protein
VKQHTTFVQETYFCLKLKKMIFSLLYLSENMDESKNLLLYFVFPKLATYVILSISTSANFLFLWLCNIINIDAIILMHIL